MTLIEAAKQAREALEEINKLSIGEHAICLPAEIDTAMDALDQAITEAEQQEPVYLIWMKAHCAWMHTDREVFDKTHDEFRWLLYTTPPKREWQGLTDNEIALVNADYPHPQGFARAIEAKLKEKNT